MQARWPLPKGLKAFTGRSRSASRLKWSGLNWSASSPQMPLSRCSASACMMTMLFFLIVYWPPILVSSFARIEIAGAVGYRRSDSFSTCITYCSRLTCA
ncbi:hypothetical protein D9M70_563100 [compost metagenome]